MEYWMPFKQTVVSPDTGSPFNIVFLDWQS